MGALYQNFEQKYKTLYGKAVHHTGLARGDNKNPFRSAAETAMSLADRMETVLAERGMTKAELSRASGVSKQNIGHLVHGTSKGGVTPETLFALADALRVEARWLAFGTGPKQSGAHLDPDYLAGLISDLLAAAEARGQKLALDRLVRLACDLYEIWETGSSPPTADQALRLLGSQLGER